MEIGGGRDVDGGRVESLDKWPNSGHEREK